MTSRKNVIGLVRVSTIGQAAEDRAGIPRQKDCIKRVVKAHQLNLIATIALEDISGTKTSDVPQIKQLLQRIRTKEIAGIVVSDLDRLFRPTKIQDFQILESFDEAGATIYSDSGIYDFASDEGSLLGIIKGVFGGMELKQIKRRMLGGRERKRQGGKLAGSDKILATGVGYDWGTERFHYTDAVRLVIEAFRLVDEEGITNYAELSRRTGLQARTLAGILRNQIFIGWRVIDKRRGGERYAASAGKLGDRKKIPRPEAEIIRNQVIDTPAISIERWDRVQRRLKDKHLKWRRERNAAGTDINLGVGVARCAFCGSRLYASSGRRRDRRSVGYYYCSQNNYLNRRRGRQCPQPNVPKPYVHDLLIQFVGSHLRDRKLISALAASMRKNPEPSTPIDSDARLRQLSQKEDRLVRLYEDADPERAIKLNQRLEEIKNERQTVIYNAQSCRARTAKAREPEEGIRQFVQGCYAFSRIATDAERHSALQMLFSEIKFRGEGIVAFTFGPVVLECVPQFGSRVDKDSSLRRA